MQELPVGTVLSDRYVVTGVLGCGGFGTVYSATHRHMERKLAIKVLDQLTRAQSDSHVRRFLKEAESAAKIDHPNVVTIYDFGFLEDGETPFIAMQLLEGSDLLTELSTQGQIPAGRSLPMVVDCLKGLHEAHRQDIVHKDLKPGNLILVRPEPSVERLVIVDFGLATLSEDEEGRITTTGNVVGTPRYLPPEYLRDRTVTPALDVYQMALILVEMITGSPVVDGDGAYANILVHASGSLELPEALVHSPLGPVLERALAYEHEDRFPNAGAFAAALALVHPAKVPDITEKDSWVALGSSHNEDPTPRTQRRSHTDGTGPNQAHLFDETLAVDNGQALAVQTKARPKKRVWSGFLPAILGAVMLLGVVVFALVTQNDNTVEKGERAQPPADSAPELPEAATPTPVPAPTPTPTPTPKSVEYTLPCDETAGATLKGCTKGMVAWCDEAGSHLACCARGLVAMPTRDGTCDCPPGGVATGEVPGCPDAVPKAFQSGFSEGMKSLGPALRACYKDRAPGPIAGKVSLRIDLSPTGVVADAKIASASLPSAAVQSCILREVRRKRFPPPPDGHSLVTYPLVLNTKGKATRKPPRKDRATGAKAAPISEKPPEKRLKIVD